jgi:hypothetical protein
LIGKKIDGLLENLRISAFTQKKNPKKNSPKKISKKNQKFKNSKIQKFKNSKNFYARTLRHAQTVHKGLAKLLYRFHITCSCSLQFCKKNSRENASGFFLKTCQL